MANSKWIALSYVCIFFAVFFGYLAYCFVPVWWSQQTGTALDTSNMANTTMALSSVASTIPGLGAISIIIILATIIGFYLSTQFMYFGV